MAGLPAGLPTSVPATTVNWLCGSSLDAAIVASRQIALGESDVVLAGGVESMSRVPWVLPKPDKAYPAGDAALVSTTLGWRLANPRMNPERTGLDSSILINQSEALARLDSGVRLEDFADLCGHAGAIIAERAS